MAKLSKDLKRMLTGLAYQNAGDYLSTSEKMKVLNGNSKQPITASEIKPAASPHSNVSHKIKTRAASKRIAFISNGDGIHEPLDFAIDSCKMQNAQIDLLIHHAADMEKLSALKKKINNAGIRFQHIQIEDNTNDSIINYIANQPSLIFLVALPDDSVAKALVDEVSSRHGNRIHTPLVLIKNQAAGALKQSAA